MGARQEERIALWCAIGAGLVVHLLAALHGLPNLDEYQFLANGWNAGRGLLPYRDFWDNHGPLATYVFRLPFDLWPVGHEVILVARLGMYVVALLTVGLTGWVYQVAFPSDRHGALAAAAFLLASEPYLAKSVEVRGDGFQTLVWVAGLGFLLRSVRRHDWRAGWVSGICMGAALWFSPKASALIAASLIVVLADRVLLRRPLAWGTLVGLAGGVLLHGLVLWGWLNAHGLVESFSRFVIHDSVTRKWVLSISPFLTKLEEYPFWMGLCVGGLGFYAAGIVRGRRRWPGEHWLWPVVLFFLFYYFVALPSRHLQSLLPMHPVVALVAARLVGHVIGAASRRARTPRAVGSLLWTLLAAGISVHLAFFTARTREVSGNLAMVIHYGNRLAAVVPPGEFALTGEGLPLARPSPIFTTVLPNFIRERYRSGSDLFHIPEALARHGVRFVVVDPRIRELPARDIAFFRSNFLPIAGTMLGPKRVLLGAARAVALDADPTSFSVAIPRHYWMAVGKDILTTAIVDGKVAGPSVYLSAGTHWVRATGRHSRLVFTTVWPAKLSWEHVDGRPIEALKE